MTSHKPQGARGSRQRRSKSPLRVLVVRHAIAKDQAEFAQTGAPDADRPLTGQGRKRMRRAAKGIARLVQPVKVIATSPLTRAVETADILAKRYAKDGHDVETLRLSALAPGRPGNLLLSWLDECDRDSVVVIVGHEPHLGQFVSWALTGLRDSFIEVKKGSAILIEFESEVRPGRAKLLWSLRPSQLRAISASQPE